MIGRIIRRLRDDQGFTLIELSVAMILSSMVVGTFVTMFFSFSQNAADVTGNAQHQEDARGVMVDLVIELRQAVAPGPNDDPIASMTGDGITFYTIEIGSSAPVKVVYQRSNCVAGECQLRVTRYASTGMSGDSYTFSTTPYAESLLLSGVLNDQALFAGQRWSGTPKTLTSITSCNGTSVSCAFPLVSVTLRSLPFGTSEGARTPFEVHEEVRLRNA
ncbi:MAG: prepilin-type N-terminal cleavage/methylation domain-containing protein [Actinomycetota bacterium]